MAYKVSIRDFMALSKADYEFDKGLNVIVGGSNEGKSAGIQALNDIFFNIGDDNHVKKGKRYAAVMVDNGEHKMMWRRDSNGKNEKTMYQFDDNNPVTKVGRGQLPEVAQYFNITEVRMANNQKVKINFWFQGDKPFLTDKTESQLYEFLSLSSCDKYNAVLKEMKEDIKSLSRKIEETSIKIDTLKGINKEKKEFLDKTKDFNELYAKIVKLNSEIQAFNKVEEAINRINATQKKIDDARENLVKVIHILQQFDYDRAMLEYSYVMNNYPKMENLRTALENINKKQVTLANDNTELIRVTEKKDRLDKVYNGFQVQISEIETKYTLCTDVRSILEGIAAKRKKKQDLEKKVSDLKLKISDIDLDSFKDEIERIEEMGSKIADWAKVLKDIQTKVGNKKLKVQTLKEAEDKLAASIAEFDKFKEQIGYCPYCNSKL